MLSFLHMTQKISVFYEILHVRIESGGVCTNLFLESFDISKCVFRERVHMDPGAKVNLQNFPLKWVTQVLSNQPEICEPLVSVKQYVNILKSLLMPLLCTKIWNVWSSCQVQW